MADKSVGELIAAQSVTPTDLFVLEQNGTAKKLTGQILENWLVSFADGHGGIHSIEKLSTSGLVDTYRITLADTTTFDFVVTNGRGITGISKTSTSGLVDTYTISYNNGTTSKFTVTNGEKGDKGDNAYVWIKYASQEPTESSHSIGDIPDDWIGIYSGNASTAPTDWKQYKWYKIKGKQGDTGAAATLVNKSVTYQVGDSGTITPSGTWVNYVPVVPQGKYLWTKTELQFNTGDPIVFYSVARIGLDGSGSVSMVNNVSPDSDGNVKLTAADVGALPSSGGDMTGAINMNGQKISGLNDPTESTEAARKGYVDGAVKKAAPRNLLDNSDFTNPVNQRGLTNYTKTADTGYTIDRWIKRGDTNTPLTVSDGCVSLTRTSDTAYTAIKQELDPDRYTHAGKTVTAVVKVQSVSGSAVLRITGGDTAAYDSGVYASVDISSAGIFTVSTTFPEKLPYPMCGVSVALMSKGATINLEWVALYEGEYTTSTMPEYQPKGYAAELLECMRYFIRFGKTSQNNHIGYAQAATANVANAVIAIPVPMRIYNPTVIVGGTLSLRTGAVDINVTSESTNSASSGPFIYMTLNATGLTSGVNYAVRLTSGTLDLSADL